MGRLAHWRAGRLIFAAFWVPCTACTEPAGRPGGDVPVAVVSVNPDSADVLLGASIQFSATPTDAAGGPLPDRPVSWSSASELVVTVSEGGSVTGVSPGIATISAKSEGRVGTARVRVVTEPADPAPGDCASVSAARIWCDDFEEDRLAAYFEYENPGGRFTRSAGVGRSGSYGMRARWIVGAQSAGALHLAFGLTPQAYMKPVDAGTARYREIYWRFFVRRQAGWNGGGGDKVTRANIFASATTFAQALAAHVWSGTGADTDYLTIDPASGTDEAGNLITSTYNDPNFRWLGAVRGNTPIFGSAASNTWTCIEAHVRLNDAGQSNGAFDVWINDGVEIQKSGINWIGSYTAYGINAIYLENYWNAGSPADQERYFDDFIVSTERIGC